MRMIGRFFFIFLFPQLLVAGESFEANTIYLTWTGDPTTTMTVQWLCHAEKESLPIVRYHAKDSTEWHVQHGKKVPLPGSDYCVNQVVLKELGPNRTYDFRINLDVNEYSFRTMPLDDKAGIRFIDGGDMYHDSLNDMEVTSKQAAKLDPDFVVVGGDIAYVYTKLGAKPERWVDWIKSWHNQMKTPDGRLIPVMAAIGNHDIRGQFDQSQKQAVDFSLLFPTAGSRVYTVVDFGNYLSLFLLDSGHANSIAGAQTDWLKKTIQERQKIKNRFAVYHVPAFPAVRKFTNEKSVAIRQNWVPIFEDNGVSAAFEHHDHIYKCSYPMLKNKPHPHGVLYIGDGGWGVDKPRSLPSGPRPYYLEKCISERHFILIDLQGQQQRFRAVNDKGEVIDELIINI